MQACEADYVTVLEHFGDDSTAKEMALVSKPLRSSQEDDSRGVRRIMVRQKHLRLKAVHCFRLARLIQRDSVNMGR